MFWADTLLKNRTGQEWINDAWTPSGMVHMGGLKGPVIHDTLFRILKEKEIPVKWTFGLDDFDPIDGLPADLRESHSAYWGVPVFMAPAPYGEEGTFADYYSNKLLKLFKKLGIEAEIYKASTYYKEGVYNKAIAFVLDHAAEIRDVYEQMYKKKVADDWYPFQVICSNCGKLGTTRVTGWDGEQVTFVCEPEMVTWARGCGHKGKMSPFNGNGKMPFKVEWAAKWWTFGVTIEGAGKDHASAGGTYDVAREICKKVFKQEPPLKIPYEFFLYHGKKMSSSKGIGLNGEELLDVLPPQIARFLMIKDNPSQAVEFDAAGDTIPNLFDDYQMYAQHYFEKEEDDYARVFELSQLGEAQKPPKVRFSLLTQWVQMPNMVDKIKEEGAEEWAHYAKVWVEQYAPESQKFMVQEDMPEQAKTLSENQKAYLKKVLEALEKEWQADTLQQYLYDLTKENGIAPKEAFSAIYLSFIGKPFGPKAGGFLLALDRAFVHERLENVIEKA